MEHDSDIRGARDRALERTSGKISALQRGDIEDAQLTVAGMSGCRIERAEHSEDKITITLADGWVIRFARYLGAAPPNIPDSLQCSAAHE